jgi:hypothetical protein
MELNFAYSIATVSQRQFSRLLGMMPVIKALVELTTGLWAWCWFKTCLHNRNTIFSIVQGVGSTRPWCINHLEVYNKLWHHLSHSTPLRLTSLWLYQIFIPDRYNSVMSVTNKILSRLYLITGRDIYSAIDWAPRLLNHFFFYLLGPTKSNHQWSWRQNSRKHVERDVQESWHTNAENYSISSLRRWSIWAVTPNHHSMPLIPLDDPWRQQQMAISITSLIKQTQ